MPGDTCVVCGNTRAKDPSVSMHHFPNDKTKRLRWLNALGLKDDDVEYAVGIFLNATPNYMILS